jgi:Cu2+-exporting ATPase
VVETLARVTHVVFDKTGTLTEGRLGLERIVPQRDLDAAECLRLAGALESVSEHPMARILRASAGADLPRLDSFQLFAGRGVDGVVGGRRLRIGRPDFVAELQSAPSEAPALPGGASLVYLGDETGWLAVFALSDVLRPDAAATVEALLAAGLQVSVLSGDAPDAVAAMAAQAGVADWQGGCLPEDKLTYVKRLQAQGAVVAVVGDGINDGPVLAAAQLSIAMSGGADLAKIQADCVLLGDRLAALVGATTVARRTLRVIRQNLAWAVAYNLIAIPLAALGWVTPWLAGVGMAASSLVVVVNALRLR